MRRRHLVSLAVLLLAFLPAGLPAAGANGLPIFDAHLHYSEDSWDLYPPAAILAWLDRAGIRRAFVSSTPDDGTVRLYEAAPERVVPVLRPYRQRGALGTWHRDRTVVPYLEERLGRGIYRGIGEFHLSGTEARSPVVRRVVELARRGGLFLHCHCDVEALQTLLALAPDRELLWAHAGMSAAPGAVGALLQRHRRLAVELSLRSDVAPGGRLDPAWRAVLVEHDERFMVGTDTWVAARWAEIVAVQERTRAWLAELPPEVAGLIASGNAERLAGGRPLTPGPGEGEKR